MLTVDNVCPSGHIVVIEEGPPLGRAWKDSGGLGETMYYGLQCKMYKTAFWTPYAVGKGDILDGDPLKSFFPFYQLTRRYFIMIKMLLTALHRVMGKYWNR